MAQEYSDRFQHEVISSLQKLVAKTIEHDQRFEQIDQRFEQIDQRFEQVDQRFEAIDQQFDELKTQNCRRCNGPEISEWQVQRCRVNGFAGQHSNRQFGDKSYRDRIESALI